MANPIITSSVAQGTPTSAAGSALPVNITVCETPIKGGDHPPTVIGDLQPKTPYIEFLFQMNDTNRTIYWYYLTDAARDAEYTTIVADYFTAIS